MPCSLCFESKTGKPPNTTDVKEQVINQVGMDMTMVGAAVAWSRGASDASWTVSRSSCATDGKEMFRQKHLTA